MIKKKTRTLDDTLIILANSDPSGMSSNFVWVNVTTGQHGMENINCLVTTIFFYVLVFFACVFFCAECVVFFWASSSKCSLEECTHSSTVDVNVMNSNFAVEDLISQINCFAEFSKLNKIRSISFQSSFVRIQEHCMWETLRVHSVSSEFVEYLNRYTYNNYRTHRMWLQLYIHHAVNVL